LWFNTKLHSKKTEIPSLKSGGYFCAFRMSPSGARELRNWKIKDFIPTT
jgi:hypothetical protein